MTMRQPAEPEGRVVAVVPTLDRIDDLTRCLDAVASQTRAPIATVVVDNGSGDGTLERVAGRESVELDAAGERLGAPGAFARGMRRAFEAEAEWVWLLDDDCVPSPTALAELVAVAGSGDDVAGSAPTVEFGDGRRETGWHWGSRATAGHGQSPNHAPGEIDWAPFAGLLLRRRACEDAGELRADFVLWHADVEYCLRLRTRGWRLLAAPAAEVTHPTMELVERRVLGRTVAVGRVPPWREYYDTRNMVLLRRQVKGTALAQRTPLRRRVAEEAKRALAVMLADSAGPRRLGMRALGTLDGVRGYMARHPERRMDS